MVLVLKNVPIQKTGKFNDTGINKCAHTKKSGYIFNDSGINKSANTKSPETYLMILVSMYPYKKVWKLI